MNLFPFYKQVALDIGNSAAVDLNSNTIKLALLDGYTFNSAHQFMNQIVAASTDIARSGALLSPTVTNGTFDAADITVVSVPSGHVVTDIVVYKDTGSDSTSTAIAHIDQDQSAVPLGLVTNGSDVLVSFDAAGIFDI